MWTRPAARAPPADTGASAPKPTSFDVLDYDSFTFSVVILKCETHTPPPPNFPHPPHRDPPTMGGGSLLHGDVSPPSPLFGCGSRSPPRRAPWGKRGDTPLLVPSSAPCRGARGGEGGAGPAPPAMGGPPLLASAPIAGGGRSRCRRRVGTGGGKVIYLFIPYIVYTRRGGSLCSAGLRFGARGHGGGRGILQPSL